MNKKFNPKEASTWAGVGVTLGTLAGTLAQTGFVKPASVLAALSAIAGAVAAWMPDTGAQK